MLKSIKIIDKYLLVSFLKTLGTVFIILFFIFVLQSIWLFIAELAGKDLDLITIIKFVGFYCPIMVPLVLPLSILLASIMTFGSFAENYEFAAMKSGGISLKRAMKPLFFITLVLSFVAFLFANNIIPEAQYRFINLRKQILQTKPAMAIGEGQFNKIGSTFSIKVEKKSGENGEFLENVTLHIKKGEYEPMSTVIKAKNGILKNDENSNLLQLELLNGYYYEDIKPKKFEERERLPFAKSSFKKYNINIDLAKLNKVDESSDILNAHNMLSMNELSYVIDSLETIYNKDIIAFSENNDEKTAIYSNQVSKKESAKTPIELTNLLQGSDKQLMLENAKSNLNNQLMALDGYVENLKFKKNFINDYWISFYDKAFVAYACLVMFFIGAPLGAIIRKGGMGLPIVLAILIFITYNFATTFGKKLAGQDAMPPIVGVAAGTILLTPLAIYFSIIALNDRGIEINIDWLIKPLKKINNKLNNTTEKEDESISA